MANFQNIIGNLKIRHLSEVKALWHNAHNRFIPNLTFAINYHFSQLKVWDYHLYNLVIHLINAIIVWWLTLLILSTPAIKNYPVVRHKNLIAFVTALMFVSHPLATESVTYIVQRLASIVALFSFLSIALYIKARLSDKNGFAKYLWFASSVVSAIFAFHSKENSYTLPFAVALIELCFFRTKKLSFNFKDYRVILIGASFIGFILFVFYKFSFHILKPIAPNSTTDFKLITPLNYFLTQFSVIIKYIQLLFLPTKLNLDYDFPLSNSIFEIRTLFSFIVILSLISLSIFLYKKNRIFSFGIAFFFLALLVESSIIPIADLIFEHRTYLPSYGFFLILSSGIYMLLWDKYKNLAISIFVVIIISNSYLTYQRNYVYENDLTLWNDVISGSPNKARAYNDRGDVFTVQNKLDEALRDYNKAIELQDSYPSAYSNRGYILTKMHKYDQALKDLNKAIELRPKFDIAYNNRGNLYSKMAKKDSALNDFNTAIELNPAYSDAYSNRGQLLTTENRFDDALSDLNKSIEINPNYPNAYLNRGCLYNNIKKRQDALIDLNKAIELNINFAEAFFNRGIVELNMNNKDEACKDWQHAESLGNKPASDLYNQFCR